MMVVELQQPEVDERRGVQVRASVGGRQNQCLKLNQEQTVIMVR